jgi:hypothetical protein
MRFYKILKQRIVLKITYKDKTEIERVLEDDYQRKRRYMLELKTNVKK